MSNIQIFVMCIASGVVGAILTRVAMKHVFVSIDEFQGVLDIITDAMNDNNRTIEAMLSRHNVQIEALTEQNKGEE